MANIFEYILTQLYPVKTKSVHSHVTGKPGMQEKPLTVPREELSPKESAARGENRAQESERTRNNVEKDDLLLSQIDEFREKAKQLQTLLAAKESKVQELQSIVNEREDKAQELELILTERQEEADKIVKIFSTKVDLLSTTVSSKMDAIERSLSAQMDQVRLTSVQQFEDSRRRNEEQIAANRSLNDQQIAAIRKVSEEQIATNKQFLEEQAIANKKLSEGQIAEVKALLESATGQLESIKTDLSEKVHSENVKCYRNIQDLFNEFDSKIEKMDEMEKGVGSVKNYVRFLTGFAAVNFIVLVGFILHFLGIF